MIHKQASKQATKQERTPLNPLNRLKHNTKHEKTPTIKHTQKHTNLFHIKWISVPISCKKLMLLQIYSFFFFFFCFFHFSITIPKSLAQATVAHEL